MSQVKNLRAMFENKGDSSPPDRGRSPGGSSTPTTMGANGNGSPRPLSRVRTNFVAVEKNGRIGLRQEPSGETSPSRQRASDASNTEASSTSTPDPAISMASSATDTGRPPLKSTGSSQLSKSFGMASTASEAPRSAFSPGALSDRPSTNPDKHVDEEQSTPVLRPTEPEDHPMQASAGRTSTPLKAKTASVKPKETAHTASSKTMAPKQTTTAARSTTDTKPVSKPPTKASGPRLTTSSSKQSLAKTSAQAPAKKEPSAAARTTSTQAKTSGSTATKRPPPIKYAQHHPDTGFVKPKPKSPTKPVSLPSSLMAHTASSVTKGSVSRQPASKQTGTSHGTAAPARASSRASASATGGAATRTVRKQGSTIGHSRPSIGPPPKSSPPQKGAPQESAVNEDFLARMMRPTQSSSSKTSDKAPATPPRRGGQRPSTRASDTSSRRESSVRRPIQAKSSTQRARTSLSSHEASSIAADEVVVETAHVETVEEAKEVAQEAEPTAAVPMDDSILTEHDSGIVEDAVEEPSVDEAALQTANVETAQDVKEVAHEANLTQELVGSDQHDILVEQDAPEEHDEPKPVKHEQDLPLESVDEAALESAHVETADEAAEVAKNADLVQTPVEPESVEPLAEPTSSIEIEDAPVEPAEIQEPTAPEEAAPQVHEAPASEAKADGVPVETHETQSKTDHVDIVGGDVSADAEDQHDVSDLVHATKNVDLAETAEASDA